MKQQCGKNYRKWRSIKNISDSNRKAIQANFWRKECLNDRKRRFVANYVFKVPVRRHHLREKNDKNFKCTSTVKYFQEVENERGR